MSCTRSTGGLAPTRAAELGAGHAGDAPQGRFHLAPTSCPGPARGAKSDEVGRGGGGWRAGGWQAGALTVNGGRTDCIPGGGEAPRGGPGGLEGRRQGRMSEEHAGKGSLTTESPRRRQSRIAQWSACARVGLSTRRGLFAPTATRGIPVRASTVFLCVADSDRAHFPHRNDLARMSFQLIRTGVH